MAEVVLDANVLVALLYAGDVHHMRARELVVRLEADGHVVVAIDFLVHEAVSVLCRRARERKTSPPDLNNVLHAVRTWFEDGHVRSVTRDAERLTADVIDVIEAMGGVLNFNDALLVVLLREGVLDELASFDAGFDVVPSFRRIS
jgi:predicted nucleic acid-binding protein